ncbi:hypothetical protein D9M69_587710 [compost metagenome]
MPLPTRAGVLGMARTTRSVPSQRAMLSDGMPAATLRCRASAAKARTGRAASAKVWGLTAHTTTAQRERASLASALATMP